LKTGIFCAVCLLCIVFFFFYARGMTVEKTQFTESARELKNPDRGFYFIYGFMIQDEETDYAKLVEEKYRNDTETGITLVQINLQNYRDQEISSEGISNIDKLFCALESIDKRLIVRFLYDWDGLSLGREPGRLDTVLLHMSQLEEVLRRHRSQIFLMQGLFIGNWGEMNGTPYANSADMQRLALELERVTDPSVYLSVRMPMQWRQITGLEEGSEQALSDHPLAKRLGLFNDGMLGSESDYGTYGTAEAAEAWIFAPWSRKEELDFQEELCRRVPNGGEVIVDNAYNDFDNACRDLSLMHVTYLNRDYDQEVLNKWAGEIVEGEGCFDGMDGLTYIQRHLGYRFLIADTDISRKCVSGVLTVRVSLKNVGFAPVYRELKLCLTVCGEKERLEYTMEQPLTSLAGGEHKEDVLELEAEIPSKDLSEREYSLYFSIVDPDTGEHILLANEQEEESFGYLIGTVRLNVGRK